MKNRTFKPLNFLFNFLVVLAVAAMAFEITPMVITASAGVAMITGTVLTYVQLPNLAFMAVQVEVWQDHIEQEIFKDNTFLRFSHNADSYVIDSKIVHIPQSGGSGTVVKNRTSLPATVRKRTDTDVIYLLDEYTTDPVLIPHADTKELSYDKRASVIGEDKDKLVQVIAENTLYNWCNSGAHGTYAATAFPAGNILSTTGANVVGGANAPSATGDRKAFSITDLQRMQAFFRKANRWFESSMYCMLDPDALLQIFPADSIVTATYMQKVTEAERRMGILFKAQGWNILSRSTVLSVTAANVVNAPGAVGAATDDTCGLFWYTEAVEFAFGGVEMFDQIGAPEYYGDIYSFLARTGARARRTGYEGIALLKQAKTG